MGNPSNAKFALSRLKQSDKDTEAVTELVRFPVKYGSGFIVAPEVDTYDDLVEEQFESSRTDILGATVSGSVEMAASADIMALLLSSMLGTVQSTNVGVGQTFAAVAATDVCTAAAHGLVEGQRVKVSSTTTLPGGLSAGTVYYAGTLTANTFKLYATYANAVNETSAIDISDTGTGTHTMTPEVYKHTITPSSSADPIFHTALHDDGTTNRKIIGAVPSEFQMGCDSIQNKRMNCQVNFAAIRREYNDDSYTGTFTANASTDVCTATAHRLHTGQGVRFTTTTTLPAGLSLATTYYVEVLTADTFKVYTSFEGASQGLASALVNITDTGTGTHTFTGYETAFPTQEEINAFHFTRPGAELKITIGDDAEATYTGTWAGFAYSLANVIDAEQRAGSNTVRVIERQDRAQMIDLMMDYDDDTFCNLIQQYQSESRPRQMKVVVTLRGKLIGQTNYFKFTGTFYNCHLGNQAYSADPTIAKQTLKLKVNHDAAAGKSCQWEIWNDIDGYLT